MEISALDVIVRTFSLFDVTIYALIDPRSTHSNICTMLVTKKNIPVESTKIFARVTNSLGQCVIVNKVTNNCPLKI